LPGSALGRLSITDDWLVSREAGRIRLGEGGDDRYRGGFLRRPRARGSSSVACEGERDDPLRPRRRHPDRPLARFHRPGRRLRLPWEAPGRLHRPYGRLAVRGDCPRQEKRHGGVAAGRAHLRGKRGAARADAAGAPRSGRRRPVSSDQVTILDGNTFVVSDRSGDIEASLTDPTGQISLVTHFLST